jgi:hypothetical protein
MSAFYGSDCPKPADHDSHGAPSPSGKPESSDADPSSAAGAMEGYDPGESFKGYLDREMAYQVEPPPGKT